MTGRCAAHRHLSNKVTCTVHAQCVMCRIQAQTRWPQSFSVRWSAVSLIRAQVDIQKLWVFISSIIIGSAFVFGNSVKQLYESVIFLFLVHPYDVGDCLLIEGTGAGAGKFFVRACPAACGRTSPIARFKLSLPAFPAQTCKRTFNGNLY